MFTKMDHTATPFQESANWCTFCMEVNGNKLMSWNQKYLHNHNLQTKEKDLKEEPFMIIEPPSLWLTVHFIRFITFTSDAKWISFSNA